MRSLGAATQQSFGDAHGNCDENWYHVTSRFNPAAHSAIMANKLLLTTVLPKIIDKRMLDIRPIRITVGNATEDRLVDGLSALEARINTTVARHVEASQAGVPVDINGSVSSLDVFGPTHLPVAAEAAAASAETKRRVKRLVSMQTMFANITIVPQWSRPP